MAGAGLARRMRRDLGRLLDQTATVYGRSGGAGPYTVVLASGLRCLLQPVAREPAATGGQRAELADLRTLYYDPDYVLPEHAQLEVSAEAGVRWNVVAGTATPEVGPGGVVVMRRADLRRAR